MIDLTAKGRCGTTVSYAKLAGQIDYEQPLVAEFTVKGNIGSSTGKRLLLPTSIFEVNSKPTFSHEKREVAVAFDYPFDAKDVVRIVFPPTLAVESLPASETYQYQKASAYSFKSDSTSTSVIFRRELALGEILFLPAEYPALRTYYGKFETKDQENVVLKVASDKTKAAGE